MLVRLRLSITAMVLCLSSSLWTITMGNCLTSIATISHLLCPTIMGTPLLLFTITKVRDLISRRMDLGVLGRTPLLLLLPPSCCSLGTSHLGLIRETLPQLQIFTLLMQLEVKCVCVCMCVCVCVNMCVHLCACVHVCVYMCILVYMY